MDKNLHPKNTHTEQSQGRTHEGHPVFFPTTFCDEGHLLELANFNCKQALSKSV